MLRRDDVRVRTEILHLLRFAVLHLHDALVRYQFASRRQTAFGRASLPRPHAGLAGGRSLPPDRPSPEGVAFVLDLSEHKRAEEALSELESDFAHMNRLPRWPTESCIRTSSRPGISKPQRLR